MHFEAGQKDGPTMRWQPNGNRELEGSYKKDRKDGVFRYYDEDGELSKTEEYKAGRLLRVKRYASDRPKPVAGR
jgi:antitoxin component YwqK of YwqJK toxin-antitoxin module